MLKPLRARDEIFAAYPEHKKLFDKDAEIKALTAFVHALHDAGLSLYRESRDEDGRPYPERAMTQYSHEMQNFIWRHVGIDPDRIWTEKTDMLNQLGMRGL